MIPPPVDPPEESLWAHPHPPRRPRLHQAPAAAGRRRRRARRAARRRGGRPGRPLHPGAASGGRAEGEFSAARAFRNVEVIAAEPHVAGSAANDRVREHLVATLRGLGLETEVQDAVAPEAGQLSGAAGGATLARVRNVVARLPGTDPTGKVFLVSHYDSVQTGPGGNDDAAGTAAILEVARALTTGPRPRNDIVFVLTDAEEACLCGAAGFAGDHPLARDGGVVLNLEARGSTGPVIMFETSRNNAKLVEIFGKAAPHPVGTSFAVEIYRALPNDTDFTAFLDRKFVGLNSRTSTAARSTTPRWTCRPGWTRAASRCTVTTRSAWPGVRPYRPGRPARRPRRHLLPRARRPDQATPAG
ncbi:M28 family peptidase [Micromonospora sp. BRA006-A]|nr:M28 family peptidase [Micromonospora sp. BRA006-A]